MIERLSSSQSLVPELGAAELLACPLGFIQALRDLQYQRRGGRGHAHERTQLRLQHLDEDNGDRSALFELAP